MLSEQQWADFTNFEGNANSFRLLTHKFCGRRDGGYAMTYSSLAATVKYPFSSLHAGEHGKFGFFAYYCWAMGALTLILTLVQK